MSQTFKTVVLQAKAKLLLLHNSEFRYTTPASTFNGTNAATSQNLERELSLLHLQTYNYTATIMILS